MNNGVSMSLTGSAPKGRWGRHSAYVKEVLRQEMPVPPAPRSKLPVGSPEWLEHGPPGTSADDRRAFKSCDARMHNVFFPRIPEQSCLCPPLRSYNVRACAVETHSIGGTERGGGLR